MALDIGDLVTNAVVGSRFGLALVWVIPVGVLGICLFAQMVGPGCRGQRSGDLRDHPGTPGPTHRGART